MKNFLRYFFIFAVVVCIELRAEEATPTSTLGESSIVINNRILAKINDKAITLMDVTKKMDMILLREHGPQVSVKDRHEFYMQNWHGVLAELIDRELVMQSAEELHVPVDHGEIRQDMEQMFGPNVIMSLETAGLTYDEVYQMLKADAIIRRMLYFHVNARVYAQVTPDDVKRAYERYLKEAYNSEKISYRMVTVKADNEEQSKKIGQAAHTLLTTEKVALDELQAKLVEKKLLPSDVTLTVSTSFKQHQDMLAMPIRKALSVIDVGQYSEPVVQTSRLEQVPVVRIYFLEDRQTSTPRGFDEMAGDLKEQLTHERLATESSIYFERLRKQYDVKLDDIVRDLPHHFEPYVIQ